MCRYNKCINVGMKRKKEDIKQENECRKNSQGVLLPEKLITETNQTDKIDTFTSRSDPHFKSGYNLQHNHAFLMYPPEHLNQTKYPNYVTSTYIELSIEQGV